MSAFEAVGMAFVIFTSTLSSIGIIYLAILGLRSVLKQPRESALGEWKRR